MSSHIRDSLTLAEAMIGFVDRPEPIAAMGAQSRRLAEDRLDVRRINGVILEAPGSRATPAP